MHQSLVIGVDGGGTKTVAWLGRVISANEYDVLGRGAAGSSNVNAVGWDEATSNLKKSIISAWQNAGLEPSAVDIAVLALSGSGHEKVRKSLVQWASENRIAGSTEVIHDAEAVLWAGNSEGWGVALISGTGSVAFAKSQSSEEIGICGGWGFWFGDEGSAFWLGQSALRAVAHADDGRGPATSLTDAIAARLNAANARSFLRELSRGDQVRHNIAALADVVLETAETGDEVAQGIAQEGARHLALQVQAASEQSALADRFPLAFAGGVLCSSEMIRQLVVDQLSELSIEPRTIEVIPDPVIGSLARACKLCAD